MHKLNRINNSFKYKTMTFILEKSMNIYVIELYQYHYYNKRQFGLN